MMPKTYGPAGASATVNSNVAELELQDVDAVSRQHVGTLNAQGDGGSGIVGSDNVTSGNRPISNSAEGGGGPPQSGGHAESSGSGAAGGGGRSTSGEHGAGPSGGGSRTGRAASGGSDGPVPHEPESMGGGDARGPATQSESGISRETILENSRRINTADPDAQYSRLIGTPQTQVGGRVVVDEASGKLKFKHRMDAATMGSPDTKLTLPTEPGKNILDDYQNVRVLAAAEREALGIDLAIRDGCKAVLYGEELTSFLKLGQAERDQVAGLLLERAVAYESQRRVITEQLNDLLSGAGPKLPQNSDVLGFVSVNECRVYEGKGSSLKGSVGIGTEIVGSAKQPQLTAVAENLGPERILSYTYIIPERISDPGFYAVDGVLYRLAPEGAEFEYLPVFVPGTEIPVHVVPTQE
jgi:hypothetical protein